MKNKIEVEKVYNVGDIVLYKKKKYKITYANWTIDEYRIEEIEEPHNYRWVVGSEIKVIK